MSKAAKSHPTPEILILRPPYERLEPVKADAALQAVPTGEIILWLLVDGVRQLHQFTTLRDRNPGYPLVIVLPSPRIIRESMPILPHLHSLNPRSILPSAELITPQLLREIAITPRPDLPTAATNHLIRTGILVQRGIQDDVRQIFQLAPETRSVSYLARALCVSRRTLGRHFASGDLPAPSHWLQFARLLYVSIRLQGSELTLGRVASEFGYPDAFTLSNQMVRVLGLRPTVVRSRSGWEWILEHWLQRQLGLERLAAMRSAIRLPASYDRYAI